MARSRDITNKTLFFPLISALAVSLICTFITVHRLSILQDVIVSGNFAMTGNISIEIISSLSIEITDSSVEYGVCKPANGSNGKFYDSDAYNMYSTTGEAGKCTGEQLRPNGLGDYLVIKNDGSINANVTIMTSTNRLINVSNTSFWFKVENETGNLGCYSAYSGWTNFTINDTEYPACNNMTHLTSPARNSFRTAFRIWVPTASPSGQETATITYTAHNAH
jgi:hypothetical protein